MALNQARVRDFARSYTEAWCSHDPVRVAAHYVPGGTIVINGGERTEITEVARAFISAFPDIEVFMDDLVFMGESVEYRRRKQGLWSIARLAPEGGAAYKR